MREKIFRSFPSVCKGTKKAGTGRGRSSGALLHDESVSRQLPSRTFLRQQWKIRTQKEEKNIYFSTKKKISPHGLPNIHHHIDSLNMLPSFLQLENPFLTMICIELFHNFTQRRYQFSILHNHMISSDTFSHVFAQKLIMQFG